MPTPREPASPLARLAALSSLIAACGAPTATAPTPDLSVLAPDLVLADLRAPGYPAGPYGSDVGSVLPNLTFQGYFSPTATTGLARDLPFGEVTLDMFRTSGKRYLILDIAAFW